MQCFSSRVPWHSRVPSNGIVKQELNEICGHWAVTASAMYLRLGLCTPPDPLACCPLPRTSAPLSAFGLEFHDSS